MVDDAHWLDSHSTRLLAFLARSNAERHELVVIGRSDDDSAHWPHTLDELTRAGATSLTVDPFGLDELVELVGLVHPRSSSRQRAELAKRLIDLRADLPLVAGELIAAADTETLALADHNRSRTEGEVWTDLVSEQTRKLASAAAISGVTWTFDQVLELTGVSPEELVDATDELQDTRLIEAEVRPDQFSFRHALIHHAFAEYGPIAERRNLHLRAADQAEHDGRLHDRARHLLAAAPTVDRTAIAQAMVTSALAHLDQQSWLEAVAAFANAERHQALEPRTLGQYAYAIERSGGDADEVRDRALAAAHAANDHATVLAIVLAGVDSGETLEGDPARLATLSSIDRHQLDAHDRRRLDVTRCRELGLAGRHDDALTLYAAMEAEWVGSGDLEFEAQAWLALWSSLMGTPPATWPSQPPDPAVVNDPVDRARLHNVTCERALMVGDRSAFDRALAALADEPATAHHPLRQWGHIVMEALRAHLDGNFTASAELATAALDIGTRHGLAGAFPARSAQVFAEHWICGRHTDLVPLLDTAAPDLRDSIASVAAHGAALLEIPERRDEGRQMADQALRSLGSVTQATHPTVAVLLAGSAQHLTEDHRAQLRTILEPHRGGAILLGAGVAHLGPASRALAFLAENDDVRQALLEEAVTQADKWELPSWSVRCRLDLHQGGGGNRWLEQAQQLAANGELAKLLD